MRYRGDEAGFYRLSSLRLVARPAAEPARPGDRVAGALRAATSSTS